MGQRTFRQTLGEPSQSTAGANSTAVVTIAASTTYRTIVTGLYASYSSSGVGLKTLTVAYWPEGSTAVSTLTFEHNYGQSALNFPLTLSGMRNKTVVATLAKGTTAATARVTLFTQSVT